jgi:hypothetical protein
LAEISPRDHLEDLSALRAHAQKDATAIFIGREPFDQIPLCHARYKFDCAVILNQQALGQLSDRYGLWSEVASDGQQRLVLLAGDPAVLGAFFAEPQELAH